MSVKEVVANIESEQEEYNADNDPQVQAFRRKLAYQFLATPDEPTRNQLLAEGIEKLRTYGACPETTSVSPATPEGSPEDNESEDEVYEDDDDSDLEEAEPLSEQQAIQFIKDLNTPKELPTKHLYHHLVCETDTWVPFTVMLIAWLFPMLVWAQYLLTQK